MKAAWYESQGPAREGFTIAERIPLAEIARAHELAEHPQRPGRVVITV